MQSTALKIGTTYRPGRLPVQRSPLIDQARLAHHNHLLLALPQDVLERISPHFEPTELLRGTVLYEAGAQIKYTYFPINSIISLFYVTADGNSVQTAMVGLEGMVGISPFMGCPTSPCTAVMQSTGLVLKIRSSILAPEFEHNPKSTQLLLRYIQSSFIQLAHAAVCNRHHTIEDQLCRWLLMTLDRQPSNEILITHELLANLIGSRREGVTEAAGNLQRLGIITYRRGHITVVDRPALERHVCECYEAVNSQTAQLLPGVRIDSCQRSNNTVGNVSPFRAFN
jgi:CRP-like cAMP-binding protein